MHLYSLKHSTLGLLTIACLLNAEIARAETYQHARLARYTQLNKPLFIAALETALPVTESKDLLEGKAAFRMQVAVEANSISARRFKRLWLEGVTINHKIDYLKQFNRDLITFSSAMKGKLLAGDRFEFIYSPTRGTVIKLNNVELAHFSSPGFGPLLLGGWVGEVPLSSSFRDALLTQGKQDRQLAKTYTSLKPSAERQRKTQVLLEADVKKLEVKTSASPPKVTHPLVVKPTTKPTTNKAIYPAASEQGSKAKQAKSNTPVVVARQEKSKPFSVAAEREPEPSNAVEKAKPAKQFKTEEENDLLLDETLMALRQSYFQQLVNEVNKYKTIPFQAFQRSWEDDVRVQITIDKKGIATQVEMLKESRYSLFNDQARDAVRRAQPFSEIPAELKQEIFTFSVPLYYRMGH